MLHQFKAFDKDRLSLDELVALEVFGEGLREGYLRMQIEEPTWVSVQLETVRREVRSRNADRLAARKKELENKLEGYKSTAEKKAEARKALAEVGKALQKAGG